ncbi:type II toxin-antitoxin system RelE/ParE family toxin [Rhizobium sp.]
MSYRLRYTSAARSDIKRLYGFLLKRDIGAAERAIDTIIRTIGSLSEFPFAARKAPGGNSFLRELIIPFGSAGYVALFEVEDQNTVTILAIRHQREEDYF